MSIYLNLGFFLAHCRLVYGHFYGLFVVGDHNGTEGTELRVHLFIIHRPEPMEQKVLLVPDREQQRQIHSPLSQLTASENCGLQQHW